ncbi:MAG: thiamine pyrophosphate-binding protein, partial [Planctomycetota bacterium]|nr:thiamine pyrophosphate-binding protein [Planctomycetota bacterium]
MATVQTAKSTPTPAAPQVRSYNGAEILVESLVRQGTQFIYAYPGGCSMPLHQALISAQEKLRTILPRHEQGGA